MPVPKSVSSFLSRHFCTKPKLPSFSNIPSKYRPHSIKEAQKALIDYLHTTRSLPYTFAEHIAKNSLFSLSNLTQNIHFSAPKFSRRFRKFLRYHPINEFEFLFESIGLNYDEIAAFLPPNKFFFYEDRSVLDAACALSGFGFPWNMLGKLYKEEASIFRKTSSELNSTLDEFKRYGFNSVSIICICLAFPHVLAGGIVAGLLEGLKSDFSEFCMVESEGDFGSCYEIYEDVDEGFGLSLETIRLSRTPTHTMNKLKFLHGIGYGENSVTIGVLSRLHGTDRELQERFDCLLRMGIEFSKLCSMIQIAPKILNQKPDILEQKVEFLCRQIGSSLEYLDVFPAFLCFDLEKRMKPRYRFHMWLRKKGLCSRDYSIASIMATSEKKFVARIFGIHPAAPKHWFETFSYTTSAHN